MFKVACLCLLAAGAAFGDLGEIVLSYAAPAAAPISLAYGTNETQLWVYCNEPPFNIYRVNADTGSLLGSTVSPRYRYTRGLAYVAGGYLFIGDYSTDVIYRVRSDNITSIVSSFSAGHNMYGGLSLKGTGDGGTGGNSLWSTKFVQFGPMSGNAGGAPADDWDFTVYLHNRTTGSIVRSFMPPGGAYDVAWDWRNGILWSANSALRAYTEAGSLLCSFRYKRGHSDRYLVGLCYDGEYLWAGSTYPVAEILKIHCPEGIGVEPSSVGKVKALFR